MNDAVLLSLFVFVDEGSSNAGMSEIDAEREKRNRTRDE